ncbi:MAG: hypothetical protein PHE24_03650 [Patescibacteria group bacterium]|nr:hypothetical protein [Patescibacteria group bacterium]
MFSYQTMDFRFKLRIVWIAALAVAVFALAWLAIIPFGKITYLTNFKGFNDFIGKLTPMERIVAEKDGTQDIIGDPAYFSLRTPRPFNQALLSVKFQVDPNLPIVEAGVSKDGRTWQYDLQPLYNAKLEELMENWFVLDDSVLPALTHPASPGSAPLPRGDSTVLLQRNKQFDTIEEFLKNPPATDKIALYNYDWKTDYLLPDYQPRQATSTMCRPLVGAYQFYTYIKNENLSDDFVFQDLNKNLDPDPIDVYVYYRDKLISSEHLDDDGIAVDSGAQKPWRHLKLDLANLPEGVYKITVRANGDIVTRTITTGQSKMAFINALAIADAPEVSCGRNFFTDGRTLAVQTSHPDKLGKITINKNNGNSFSGVELNIDQTYKIFTVNDLPPAGSQIILNNDGISLSGDGLFSLSAEQMIDPRVKSVDAKFDADQEGVDYVLARYTPPVKQGDWLVAQANFDLTNAFRMWNKYYFLISAPGLSASDQLNDQVRIKEIKVDLTGTSLWKKIFKK